MIFLLGCAILALIIISIHCLKSWRRHAFDIYMDNIDDNLKRMPAESWILNGEYALDSVNREKSIKAFENTPFWDHDFPKMLILNRKSGS